MGLLLSRNTRATGLFQVRIETAADDRRGASSFPLTSSMNDMICSVFSAITAFFSLRRNSGGKGASVSGRRNLGSPALPAASQER
jgi:hypothetical protein